MLGNIWHFWAMLVKVWCVIRRILCIAYIYIYIYMCVYICIYIYIVCGEIASYRCIMGLSYLWWYYQWYVCYILCYACYLAYISSHLQHTTPVITATRLRLIYFRWLNWPSIASLKFSVCTQLQLVRVPNARHMTKVVALSIASDLVGSNPVVDGAIVSCGLCCPHLPLPDDLLHSVLHWAGRPAGQLM